MAEYSKLIITNTGKELFAEMLTSGTKVEFTKVQSSSTKYNLSELEKLNELSNVQQSSLISNVTINSPVVTIEASFTNELLVEGYYVRTLGLYAYDPVTDCDILYAVTIETSGNCYIPSYNGVTVAGLMVTLLMTIENTDNISLNVNNNAVATIGDIKQLRDLITTKVTNGVGIITPQMLSEAVKGMLTGGSVAVVGNACVDLPNLNGDLLNFFSKKEEIIYQKDVGNVYNIIDGRLVKNTTSNNSYYAIIIDVEPGYYAFDNISLFETDSSPGIIYEYDTGEFTIVDVNGERDYLNGNIINIPNDVDRMIINCYIEGTTTEPTIYQIIYNGTDILDKLDVIDLDVEINHVVSRNKINPTQLEAGMTLAIDVDGNSNGSTYEPTAANASKHVVTGFIPVTANRPVYFSKDGIAIACNKYCLYDIARTFVRGSNTGTEKSVTPSVDGYIRVDFFAYPMLDNDGVIAHYQVEYDEVSAHTEYVDRIDRKVTTSIKWDNIAGAPINTIYEAGSYGIKGDGVTDDTEALQAALNAAQGNTLHIPKGTYIVSTTLTIPSHTKVMGDGAATVIKLANDYELTAKPWRTGQYIYPIICTAENSIGVTIRDIAVEGSVTFTDHRQAGIGIIDSMDAFIENVIVRNINDYADEHPDKLTNALGWGLAILRSDHVNVAGGRYEICGYENIGIEASRYVVVDGTYCGNAWRTGLQIHRGSNHVKVVNCNIVNENPNAHSALTIHSYGSLDTIDNVVIANNTIVSKHDVDGFRHGGIQCVTEGRDLNYTIVNNDITGNFGIVNDSSRTEGALQYGYSWIVTGNRIFADVKGIDLLTKNVVCKDNIIESQDTAITISDTGTGYICKDNILTRNTVINVSGNNLG